MAATRCSSKDFPYPQRKVLQTVVSSRLRAYHLTHLVEVVLITVKEIVSLASLNCDSHHLESLGQCLGLR